MPNLLLPVPITEMGTKEFDVLVLGDLLFYQWELQ